MDGLPKLSNCWPGLLKEIVFVPAICVNVNGEALVVGMAAKASRKNNPHVL